MSQPATSWRGLISSVSRTVASQLRAMAEADQAITAAQAGSPPLFTMRPKLRGRAFYDAIGSPKYIVAPMVDRSEFAWRLLTRSYLTPQTSRQLLAYTPMLHARLFQETARFRNEHFQPTKLSLETPDPPLPNTEPFLDGNPSLDRPLIVQFCANKPAELLAAAHYVAPYCDAVDLNLGCPQGIAKTGKYGAFLQEDWQTIHNLIRTLDEELAVPVTAKMRILDTKERTLEYAKTILDAGASILTVHGRRREQKGHNTGLADWEMIRFLRDNLPKETVLFANGNILNKGDLEACLEATGADGVMSAEGNLSDPTIFAEPPVDEEVARREYWWSLTDPGIGGYRLDGMMRRYLDIIYRYVLERDPPTRKPLWVAGDADIEPNSEQSVIDGANVQQSARKKTDKTAQASPSIRVMQGHLFGFLKPLLSVRTEIRDFLSRTRAGDFEGFEQMLTMVEGAVKDALQEESKSQYQGNDVPREVLEVNKEELTVSQKTAAKYKRPWWVAQPHIRPLPEEAIALGALKVGKKEKAKAELEKKTALNEPAIQRLDDQDSPSAHILPDAVGEMPKPALVCG